MNIYPPPKFIVEKRDDVEFGIIEWGRERNSLSERYHQAVEINGIYTAIYELKQILEDDTFFLDGYNAIGWIEMDMLNYGNALEQFQTAYKKSLKFIPKNFKGLIEWGFLENRPYLRTLQGMGIAQLYTHQYAKAAKTFEKILAYNPNDNQGVRAAALHAYMALGNFKAILNLCNLYQDDAMPDVLYAKVYALFRLDKQDAAKKALQQAIEYSPNIAAEISKKRHKAVSPEARFAFGSEDEAADYWSRVGIFWTDPRLMDFVKKGF